jgi:hypothetical protein
LGDYLIMAITINGTTGISGVDGSAGTPALQGSDPNTGIYSPGADQVAVATNGTGRLFVDASGNVGIGDNNPAAKLHVEDNTNDTSPGSTALVRLESTGAGTDAGIRFKSGVSAYTQIGGIGGNLYAYTNGSEKLRITSAGLVGIGTSSPSGFIHIQGASTGTETYGRFTTGPANGDQSLVIKSGSSRDHMAIQVSTNAGAADDLALQPDGGNVGIGTSSPAYKCDIDVTGSALRLNSTTTGAALVISSDDAANAKIEFGDESDNDRGAITYDNPNNALIFQANAAERLRIANTGALGLSGANYGTSGQVLTSQGSGSAPQWATPAGGKILQVVHERYSNITSYSCNNNNPTQIGALNATITPSSISSKILVSYSLMHDWSAINCAYEGMFNLYRAGNDAAQNPSPAAAPGSRNLGLIPGVVTQTASNNPKLAVLSGYVDSPASTSALNYVVYAKQTVGSTQTLYVNRLASDTNNSNYERGVSWITLMEIEA